MTVTGRVTSSEQVDPEPQSVKEECLHLGAAPDDEPAYEAAEDQAGLRRERNVGENAHEDAEQQPDRRADQKESGGPRHA